jgi:hypothetical protein
MVIGSVGNPSNTASTEAAPAVMDTRARAIAGQNDAVKMSR